MENVMVAGGGKCKKCDDNTILLTVLWRYDASDMSFHFVNALWLGACFFNCNFFRLSKTSSGVALDNKHIYCLALLDLISWEILIWYAWFYDHACCYSVPLAFRPFSVERLLFLVSVCLPFENVTQLWGALAEGSLALLFVCIIHSEIQFCPLYFPAQGFCLFREPESLNNWEWTVATMQATKGNLWVCGGRSTIAAVLLLLVLSLAIEDVHRRCIQWMEDVKIWMWYLIYSIGLFLESLGLPSWRWKTFI